MFVWAFKQCREARRIASTCGLVDKQFTSMYMYQARPLPVQYQARPFSLGIRFVLL